MCAVVPAASATDLRTFTPGSDAELKHTTVCHDIARDVYVIAAVFTRTGFLGLRYDTLYRARVQGRSTSANYGELLETPVLVRSERRIDNVDCASDGAGSVFVALDRYGADAAWYRFDGTTTHGPYEVPRFWCNPHSHRPRIAYGANRVMIAFEGHRYSGGTDSCEVCVQQFNPQTGAPVAGTSDTIWNDNMTHTAYDVEWNGSDRFVLALPYALDAGPEYLATYTYLLNGTRAGENELERYTIPGPAFPQETRIVFSHNVRNPSRMFVQTSSASYWINRFGARVSSPHYQSIGTGFALCEYWGADAAVAHLLTPSWSAQHMPGLPGGGSFLFRPATLRAHYGTSPGPAYESMNVNMHYVPLACSGADTYSDAELFVISKPGLGAPNTLTWNILPND